jgi:hypothetical protein
VCNVVCCLHTVPVGPGRCRLLNRNTFKFNKGGLGAAVARTVMQLAPDWAIHMGTQVGDTLWCQAVYKAGMIVGQKGGPWRV